MESREECLREAAECDRLAGLANTEGTRRTMTLIAFKWRKLAGIAEAREQSLHSSGMPRSASARRVGPAVAEALIVLNFVKGGVKLSELFADAPDAGSNVRPIAQFPKAADEAFVILNVVDRAIGDVATDV